MNHLARSLATCACLHTLRLSWCGLDSDPMLIVAKALASNSALVELDVSNNRVQARREEGPAG